VLKDGAELGARKAEPNVCNSKLDPERCAIQKMMYLEGGRERRRCEEQTHPKLGTKSVSSSWVRQEDRLCREIDERSCKTLLASLSRERADRPVPTTSDRLSNDRMPTNPRES